MNSSFHTYTPLLQYRLRKMSKNPWEEREFSQPKIFVIFGFLLIPIAALAGCAAFAKFLNGRGDKTGEIVAVVAMLFVLFIIPYQIYRRFGVNRDKVWSKVGKWFYKSIEFKQIKQFVVHLQGYKIYTDSNSLLIDYNRFDYALVHLQILEQLQIRRFKIGEIDIYDAGWENEAQKCRNMLGQLLYRDHKNFFDSNPAALAHLNALMFPGNK
ncbi:hypothetical protein KRX54_00450 [Actinomycetaceae bacterium TAE3-ERU4]|nr:hypothetical protein [Actinomycetaceae bacterium TAE3-ERU4]